MNAYDKDIVAWANQQAKALREGRFNVLDIEHIADEIEDVGRNEQRELARRLATLLTHLLKWQVQPERRCVAWKNIIAAQRPPVLLRLKRTPSLESMLSDLGWLSVIWIDAVAGAVAETGLAMEAAGRWRMCFRRASCRRDRGWR